MELNREQIKKDLDCFHQRILNTNLAEKITETEVMSLTDALSLITQQETEYNELYELCESYRKELGEVKTKDSTWISVDVELPQKRGRYLVVCKGVRTPVVRFYGNCWNCLEEVTHWMPFPKLPTEK